MSLANSLLFSAYPILYIHLRYFEFIVHFHGQHLQVSNFLLYVVFLIWHVELVGNKSICQMSGTYSI